jgi:hypothetical protein
MPDSHNLAVDPASPDAHVEDHFFKQGVDQEGHAKEDHFDDYGRDRKGRLLLVGAGTGGAVCFAVALVLLFSGPSEPEPAVAAVAPVSAPAPAPPPTPAPAVAAAVPAPEPPAPPAAEPVAAAAAVPAAAVIPAPPPAAVPVVAAEAPAAAVIPAPPPAAVPVVAAAVVPVVASAPVAAPEVAPAGDFAALEQTCRSAYGKRRYRDVLDSCGRALDARPEAAPLAALIAEMEFDRGRLGQALTWARKAVAVDPNLADAYVFIGGAEQHSGHADAARTAYLKYLELAPRGRYASDLRAIVKQ